MLARRALIVSPLASFLVTLALLRLAPRPSRAALPAPSTVLVTGHESRWQFRYPGPDGVVGTPDDIAVTGQEDVHLPFGPELRLILQSDDYLYTFSVPGLGVKGTAVPGLTSTLRVPARRLGGFPVDTDLMCGQREPHPPLRLLVEPLPEFLDWLESVRPLPTPQPPG